MSEKKERTIYQKLFDAKKEFTSISKDQKNPHFKSAYYDINDLHKMADPVLHSHGLMIMNPINEGKITTQIVDIETGEMITSSFTIEYNANPQKVGSEITYYRRYLLSSLLGLQADDDDGNKASTKKAQEQSKKPKKDFQEGGFEKALSSVFEGEVKAELIISKYNLTDEQLKQLKEAEKTIKNK